MWSEKKPWWQQKAKKHEGKHAKNAPYARSWCVAKVAKQYGNYNLNTWGIDVIYEYKALVRSNAPQYWNEARQKFETSAVMDYLTKPEAIACAKGLNFLDEGN